MPRQRHEIRLAAPITTAFAALLDVAARGRWGGPKIVLATPQPRIGCEYAQQRGTVLRRGKVTACARPVSLTLEELLLDPPCRVRLRLHWRVEPLEDTACVLLEARYLLRGAAVLRPKHWHGRIHGHCERMLAALGPQVAAVKAAEELARRSAPSARERAFGPRVKVQRRSR